ncbi:aminotransferase class III-fold pyridoxal phosphate-dependent enzyme [Butyrivibrio sp. YAB3001]|uniref:aminotransferase class III-fold pyridoxal phosphate-dependent enzyme n=1 Tax=Butyrivibrio sp. YAB3001 TaxID=1520812 RepID=UPI000B873655|nr:aminotransferase class III-fold pyridoxal phosphate-dependent enzyme [Butyrivibrio sp. YAB3001]
MDLYNRQVRHYLPGGVHQNFNFPWREVPIYSVRTKNSHIWDMDGKEYLDLFSYHGATILGNGNKKYSAVMHDVVKNNMGAAHTDFELQTIELIHKTFSAAQMIRFGVSESEMINDAIRLSRVFTGRKKIVRFENQYIGSNDNLLGDNNNDFRRTQSMGNIGLEDSYVIRWNEIAAFDEVIGEHGKEIACVVMEPVSVSHGSIEPEKDYLQQIRKRCDKNGIVLVFDETNTGIRAHYGGAQELYGVKADLMILGKAIAGGVPISVLAGKKELMSLYQTQEVIQGGDYNGYSLGMAAINTTMSILFDNDLKNYKYLQRQAEKIKSVTSEVSRYTEFPMTVQGPLLCSAIHCSDKVLKSPDDYTQEILMKEIVLNDCMQRNGLLVETPLTLYPNLMFQDSDLGIYADRLEKAVKEAIEVLEA